MLCASLYCYIDILFILLSGSNHIHHYIYIYNILIVLVFLHEA